MNTKTEIETKESATVAVADNETVDVDEVIDVEEYAKTGRKVPPRARHYQIRIDKQKFVVKVPAMTGRELLNLAGKTPATNFMISQKFRGGEARKIGYDEKADFTAPGVERFMTLPLDQTDGGAASEEKRGKNR